MLPTQPSQHPLLFLVATVASVLTFLRRHQILAKIAALAMKIKRTNTSGTRGEELIEATTELTFDVQKHSARISFSRHSIRRSAPPKAGANVRCPTGVRYEKNPPRKSKRRIFARAENGVLR
jgi:hypothetical protein